MSFITVWSLLLQNELFVLYCLKIVSTLHCNDTHKLKNGFWEIGVILRIQLSYLDLLSSAVYAQTSLTIGYPTLKLFSKGQVVEDYKGRISELSFQAWIKKLFIDSHDNDCHWLKMQLTKIFEKVAEPRMTL